MPLRLDELTIGQLTGMTVRELSMLEAADDVAPGDYYIPPGAAENWREAQDPISLMMQRVAGVTPVATAPTNKHPTPIAFMAELDLYDGPWSVPCHSIR